MAVMYRSMGKGRCKRWLALLLGSGAIAVGASCMECGPAAATDPWRIQPRAGRPGAPGAFGAVRGPDQRKAGMPVTSWPTISVCMSWLPS